MSKSKLKVKDKNGKEKVLDIEKKYNFEEFHKEIRSKLGNSTNKISVYYRDEEEDDNIYLDEEKDFKKNLSGVKYANEFFVEIEDDGLDSENKISDVDSQIQGSINSSKNTGNEENDNLFYDLDLKLDDVGKIFGENLKNLEEKKGKNPKEELLNILKTKRIPQKKETSFFDIDNEYNEFKKKEISEILNNIKEKNQNYLRDIGNFSEDEFASFENELAEFDDLYKEKLKSVILSFFQFGKNYSKLNGEEIIIENEYTK